ncbi:D site albumin promoter binding protein b isoform X2 [Electrophorus electricus]|uniref:BZIP domain-containing protein n=1 Tax=Electrophorus electricus TaxID=8005 RepID=A0A4W4FR46_ELEEL|nr:D site albumin promoter binding protein b isoform X2 [Electrophorus electricus]
MMAGPLSQLLPPDLPTAGASPQFGSTSQAGSGGHMSPVANLKSLLQFPMKADPRFKGCCDIKDKDRLDAAEDPVGHCPARSRTASGLVPDGSGTGVAGFPGANSNGFLGPSPWERSLQCDGSLFQLQYMDLEEFLTENSMGGASGAGGASSSSAAAQVPSQSSQSAVPNQSAQCPNASPPSCSSSSPVSAHSSSPPSLLGLDVHASPSMLGVAGSLHGAPQGSLEPTPSTTSCPPIPAPPGPASGDLLAPFDPDPPDVALPSIPGREAFDPRRHCFSEGELRPQPMVKKARKTLVPDSLKDEKYWSRRSKNNEAAKRSRDARRLKENQISVRAAFLERENAALRQEVADMRKELGRCRNILHKYESRHGDQ